MKMTILNKGSIEKGVIIFAFLLIPVTLLLVFGYYPAIKLVQLSLSDWNGYSQTISYVGFDNYVAVLTNEEYYSAFFHNLAYIVSCFLMVALSLYVAIILNTSLRGRNFYRTILFLPYVVNGVAVALMFNFLFDFNDSPINVFLRWLGFDGIRFISPNYSVNFSLSLVVVWRHFGFFMVLFLAGLQSIPQDLYDSAKIDGAGFGTVIHHIIIPSIRRIIEICLFLAIATSMQVFYEPFLITRGGPAGASHTFVSKIIDVAFHFSNFGKASAMGVVLLLLMILIIGVQRYIISKGAQYHE